MLTRSEINNSHVKYLKKGTPWQPDVFLINVSGKDIVIKDYSGRGFFCRVMGWFVIRRECLIYSRLHDLKGIPEFYGRIDRHAFAIRYISGKTSADYKRGELPASFFEKVQKIVSNIHKRGIVLCDMRNNKNILVSEDKDPYLIDFAASFCKGIKINIFKNLLYNIFHQDDLHGILKLKYRLYPELLTAKEVEIFEKGLPFQKEVIFVRDKIRKHLKKLIVH